jgi:predicted transcriptional regulator
MKRRDSTKVIHDILLIAWHGAVKTQIVSRANLNSRLTESYLDFLTAKGYVSRHHSGRRVSIVYQLTEEGKGLLDTLQRVENQLEGLFPINRGMKDTRRRP